MRVMLRPFLPLGDPVLWGPNAALHTEGKQFSTGTLHLPKVNCGFNS